ncbi:MAG TPA: PCYCGC motif-containing (lipo)protein [Thermoanaerobaculia bacterium]|nr:PCYCGC motif-containing (lipo)protein [Thermoanaerobaculia bacterium]
MKLRPLPSIVILILLAAACSRQETSKTAAATPPPPPSSSAPMPEMAGMAPSTEPPPGRNAPVLAAAQLTNPAAVTVYAEAAQITDRLAKMYCYCQCHEERGHVSLLTCFQTHHAEECGICLREANQAYMDWKNGLPVHHSQHAADVAFHRGSPPPSLPE